MQDANSSRRTCLEKRELENVKRRHGASVKAPLTTNFLSIANATETNDGKTRREVVVAVHLYSICTCGPIMTCSASSIVRPSRACTEEQM
jgi:hypothetical protein